MIINQHHHAHVIGGLLKTYMQNQVVYIWKQGTAAGMPEPVRYKIMRIIIVFVMLIVL